MAVGKRANRFDKNSSGFARLVPGALDCEASRIDQRLVFAYWLKAM